MNTAARQAFVPPPQRRRSTERRSVGRRQYQSGVTSLPQSQPLPRWLVLLLVLQRYSLVTTLGLATCTFGIYGWSVYSQQVWSDQYRQLEQLKRDERQLTGANAALYDQASRPTQGQLSGLVLQKPDQTLFLPPEPQRPWQTPASPPLEPVRSSPVGY
ncbi:hypothetical protein [Leptolyngbya sp. FACHB-261]|uniref:hypothetical protein n=1 Tax=Leptolyngbya sp. FACHB-261 TaxID=2692806 RepID=UPI00168394C3|nr:hypothetical protein [Leptolyngbya sp. FACHB-261]MBD2103217.1 hypothetical protein [Leptolyngbya sp. FACHB-261]